MKQHHETSPKGNEVCDMCSESVDTRPCEGVGYQQLCTLRLCDECATDAYADVARSNGGDR